MRNNLEKKPTGAALLNATAPASTELAIKSGTSLRLLTACCWIFCILLFTIEAWHGRFDMNHDGVQYLDMGDAYMQGDWQHAVNTQWSPLYAWLQGFVLHVARPSGYWEFPVVHAVNWGIAIFSLACFQFFLNAVVRTARLRSVPSWTITLVGFAAYLYTTLDFTNLAIVTPDLLMHGFAYLTAGYLVRTQAGLSRNFDLFLLGLCLGVGYLAKAPFFFFGLLTIFLVAVVRKVRDEKLAHVALVIAAFAVIAAPYIGFISHWKHRLTYGDSGPYNVAWMVNGMPYRHWQGKPGGSGTPLHPTRQISTDPPAYEFATPIAGTYPPWYDPIYWNEGAKPRYGIAEFTNAAVRGAREYQYVTHHRQIVLVFGLAVLALVVPKKRDLLQNLKSRMALLCFAIAPFLMYAIVHVDPRFLTSFFTILWVSLFATVLEAAPENLSSVFQAVIVVACVLMAVECLIVSVPTTPLHGMQDRTGLASSADPYWRIADGLASMGMKAGDPVAIVGDDLPYFWARLARVKVIAEVVMSDPSCKETANRTSQWERVKAPLAGTGAKWLVSPCIHGVVDQSGWQPVGETGVYAYRF